MASTYPTTLDSLSTTKADATATITDHAAHHDDMADAINKIEAELGTLPKGNFATVKAAIVAAMPVGAVVDYAGATVPAGWLKSFGQSLDRTTYALLYAALVANKSTFTVTLASPGVFTNTAHGLVVGDPVFFTTTGALYTGLTANTIYYVMTVPTTDTFTVGTTRSVAAATGVATVTTAVNTSGTQGGTHTLFHAPHGIASSTTFNAPDYRGNQSVGLDNMGGTDATNLGSSNVLGTKWGEDTHTLSAAESGLPAHTHTFSDTYAFHCSTGSAFGSNNGIAAGPGQTSSDGTAGIVVGSGTVGAVTGGAQAAANAHNNVQPVIQVNKIIFAGV